MSYDIYLKSVPCPHCGRLGEEPDCPDPTYNLSPMIHMALTGSVDAGHSSGEYGLVVLNKRTAKNTLDELSLALARLNDPSLESDFRKLEPENKWGVLEDAVSVIGRLIALAQRYPDHKWEVR